MSTEYKIVDLKNHNITLEFDQIRMNFPLPIVDGKYPEGEALQKMLSSYVKKSRDARAMGATKAKNESSIKALVVKSTHPSAPTRVFRQRLLQLTDWTQLLDAPLSPSEQTEWKKYRQALRNLGDEIHPSLAQVKWPVPPQPIKNPLGRVVTEKDGTPVANRSES